MTMTTSIKDKVNDLLRTVDDPELGMNIVDLGLIYEVKVSGKSDDQEIYIVMTLTTPGCPLGGFFMDRVSEAVATGLGIDQEKVRVRITFDPPWAQDMMTEEARMQLGLM